MSVINVLFTENHYFTVSRAFTLRLPTGNLISSDHGDTIFFTEVAYSVASSFYLHDCKTAGAYHKPFASNSGEQTAVKSCMNV